MTFSRSAAGAAAKNLTDAELARVIQAVCGSFPAAHFPGVRTLSEVRQLVDVLEHENGRREKATAEHQIRPAEQ